MGISDSLGKPLQKSFSIFLYFTNDDRLQGLSKYKKSDLKNELILTDNMGLKDKEAAEYSRQREQHKQRPRDKNKLNI